MNVRLFSAALLGADCQLVEVEVSVAPGRGGEFVIVGLPDTSVQESRERIRGSFRSSQWAYPYTKRTVVNLAPGNLKKVGSCYDLPMAVGIWVASQKFRRDWSKTLLVGELSLDGRLRATRGVLPVVMFAKEAGFSEVFIPAANQIEVQYVHGLDIFPVATLEQVLFSFKNNTKLAPVKVVSLPLVRQPKFSLDQVSGQFKAKRALMIAAAGGHNLLFVGPPGCGKTMLAQSLVSILPPLTPDEVLEVSQIYSLAGLLNKKRPLVQVRPFRNPHHSATLISLLGGGKVGRPGEVSLAHRGILFLDELLEFNRATLESLRQPLSDHEVTITRANYVYRYPADFRLVAAFNPCPCGYLGAIGKECTCSQLSIQRYRRKLSGPLLDRIDLIVKINNQPLDQVTSNDDLKQVKVISSVRSAQKFAQQFSSQSLVEELSCQLDEKLKEKWSKVAAQLGFSWRSSTSCLRVARTIANLDQSELILEEHLQEALDYKVDLP